MIKVKNKICKNPGCENEFTPYSSLQKYCSFKCTKDNEKTKTKVFKAIPKKSEKRKKEDLIYLKKRFEFLNKKENKICPVFNIPTTDVHHKKGRVGYADEWARLNGISLYLDVRFWLAVSRKGHKKIEENPTWAKENNYSLNRLTK